MFKKIFYPVLFSLIIPFTAFAQTTADHGNGLETLFEEHWHDIPVMLAYVLAAIFAYRIAFLYGGIIGKALNLFSLGLLIVAVCTIVDSFLLHLIGAEESTLHYIVDFVEVVGAGLITFSFIRLHAETKNQFSPSEKK